MKKPLKNSTPSAPQVSSLRRQAEEILQMQQRDRGPVAPEDAQRLLHELEVHQIELEMQNDELRQAQAELEASRARYFDLYDLAPVGYCTLSDKGLILEANLTACSLLGLDRKKLLGHPLSRFILAEDANVFYQQRKKLLETGMHQTFRIRMLRQEGALFWARMEMTEAQDSETGDPVFRAVLSDITESKLTDEKLKQSEARYTDLAEQSSTISWEVDDRGLYTYVSPVAEAVLGYRPEELVGLKYFYELHPESDREALKKAAFSFFNRMQPFVNFVNSVLTKDGRTIWVSTNGIPILRADGTLQGYSGSDTDITELRRVEAELHETEALLIETQQMAHLGTLTYNTSTDEVRWSDEIYRIFGLPAGKSMNYSDIMQYVHPEDYPAFLQAWISIGDEKPSIDGEYRIVRPDGEIRFIHEYSIYKYISSGQTMMYVGLLQDITDRRLAEQAVQAKNAELERFTYSVSHDLKSPLVTIRTFMGHLVEDLAGGSTDHVAQDLAFISSAAEKMNMQLDELLNFSKVGRGVNPSIEATLQEMAQEAIGLVAGRIDKRGVRVQVMQKPAVLYGDRVRLVEVFQNLIDNAVKFMGEQSDPLIEIGAETNDGKTVCFVRDNGMGIDMQHKDMLFGMFAKLNPEIEGTGMGLALVKRIVELHGGRIWVESEGIGKGVCFWFSLPGKSSEL